MIQKLLMDDHCVPLIKQADVIDHGIMIAFDNGKELFYPATLLWQMSTQAKEISKEEQDEDENPTSSFH